MNIQDCHSREDLDRYIEHKLGEYNLQPKNQHKLQFLYGAREALSNKKGAFEWHERFFEIKNLVNAEIARLRAEGHTQPTLF